jgi:hypothetical protein
MKVHVPGQYFGATVLWEVVPVAFGVITTRIAPFVRMSGHGRR